MKKERRVGWGGRREKGKKKEEEGMFINLGCNKMAKGCERDAGKQPKFSYSDILAAGIFQN
jgi:hypothetical protein